jgi:enoyl-CoA hydratase
MGDLVQIERVDGHALLRLNRPEKMNALSVALREEAVAALDQLADEADIVAVILTGNGRAFSAGVDLGELSAVGGAPKPSYRGSADLVGVMRRFPKPIIGAVNGVAITGGFELALGCDILIAGESARFADTHARVGLLPGWGMSQMLPKVIGPMRAKHMSLTGNFIDAATAAQWGLVSAVVADDELIEHARSLASDIASCDQRAVRNLNRLYDAGMDVGFSEGLKLEKEHNTAHMAEVSPQDIADRRAEVQARGRSQG